MASLVKVNGVNAILRALDKSDAKVAAATARGLKKAGLVLQRESQKIVPIDTGALKNSAFTRATGAGFDTEVIVGYTQEYAIYVHEDLNARHAPGKEAKFLEGPARRLQTRLARVVAAEAEKV